MAKSNRIKRKSLRNKGPLNFEQREGYVRRVVNLNGRNYEDALELGYKPVQKSVKGKENVTDENVLGNSVVKTVNPHSDGQKGILMEIPVELYEENKKAKAEDVDEIQSALDPKGTGSLDIKKV